MAVGFNHPHSRRLRLSPYVYTKRHCEFLFRGRKPQSDIFVRANFRPPLSNERQAAGASVSDCGRGLVLKVCTQNMRSRKVRILVKYGAPSKNRTDPPQ